MRSVPSNFQIANLDRPHLLSKFHSTAVTGNQTLTSENDFQNLAQRSKKRFHVVTLSLSVDQLAPPCAQIPLSSSCRALQGNARHTFVSTGVHQTSHEHPQLAISSKNRLTEKNAKLYKSIFFTNCHSSARYGHSRASRSMSCMPLP